jgi:hypothetical protein
VERKQERAEKAKDMGDQIAMNIMTNKLDPRILNTQIGQDFLRKNKLDKHPGIRAAISEAEARRMAAGEPTDLSTLQGKPEISAGGEGPQMGGPLVNVPKPMPGIDEVQKTIEGEETAKALDISRQEKALTLANQMAYQEFTDLRKKNKMMTIDQQIREYNAICDRLNIPPTQRSFSLDEEGNLRITASMPDTTKSAAASDRRLNREIQYENYISQTGVQKTAHMYRLRSILERDVALEELAMDAGVSAPVAKALNDAISALSKSTNKDKILERASTVESLLKSVNLEIDQYNRRNAVAAKGIGLGPKEIELRKVPPLTFEEVSGGITKDDWLKRRQPEKPEKLASDIRNESRGTSIPGQPSAASAASDSDKVKTVFDGLKDIVLGAVEKRPDLTRDQIRGTIMDNKDAIMAEYGLSERLFSLVVSMADRVLG